MVLISLIPLSIAPGSDSMTIKTWPLFKNSMLGLLPQRRLWLIELYIPDNEIGAKKRIFSKLPQGWQGLNRLMIDTQVYSSFACYQMSRPQSILMMIYLDILKCIHYLLHMYLRQCFLKSMIVFFFMKNSRKPGICISYSSKRSSALYWLHNDSLYAKGFYCSIYLFMW